MPDSHQDPLDAALAGLERPRASADFTRTVLARLDEGPARAGGPWRLPAWAWAGAAAALLAIAWLALAPAPRPRGGDLAAEAESLRRRHQELRRDLEALEALREASAPVLVLDSGADYDLVLDLRTVLDEGGAGRASQTTTADSRRRP